MVLVLGPLGKFFEKLTLLAERPRLVPRQEPGNQRVRGGVQRGVSKNPRFGKNPRVKIGRHAIRFYSKDKGSTRIVKIHQRSVTVILAGLAIFCPRDVALAEPAQPLLNEQQFGEIEQAIDRGLTYLLQYQRKNGGYYTINRAGDPAITSICIMAMLARGHQPGHGPYGQSLDRAIDYVLSCQQSDGMLAVVRPEESYVAHGGSHTVNYNQGIAGLMLCEVYGMTTPERDKRIKLAIERALGYCLRAQNQSALFGGSWGYDPPVDQLHVTDMSVVSWNIMFLRSAKNAGFDVPAPAVKKAMDYVHRSYLAGDGGFRYHIHKPHSSESMTAVGIVMLSLGGERDSKEIASAAAFISQRPWNDLESQCGAYSAYYTSLAALHLGDPFWSKIFLPIMDALLMGQQPDGSWPATYEGRHFSPVYTSSMCVLALSTPLQLMPIYQP